MSSSRTTTSISDVDVAKTQLHKHDLQAKQHLRTLAWLTLGSRACVWFLMAAAAHLPLFDSSPLVLMPSSNRVLASGMRWDMFYFAAIARNGYQYEQQWAFLPGPALVMRLGAKGLQFVKSDPNSIVSWDDLLLGGIAFVLSMSTTRTMYKLSLHHLRWHQLAFLASCLSLLPSSPVTLYVAPYSEPFFTYLSYHGMLFCARRQWLLATASFASASMFRSNGALLAGFIIWGVAVEPLVARRQLPRFMACAKAAVLTAIILAPSLAYQYVAYRTFCLAPAVFGDIVPDWCDNTIPSIYNHVQSKYWNVGFLRYWTPSQAPNILLAAPVLSLIFTFGWYHLQAVVPGLVATILHIIIPNPKLVTSVPSSEPFLNLTLTPHVIHGVLLSAILLFAAHTQIALRLAASMPLTYWAAAWLLVRHPAWGRRWVTWSVVWGAISVVLWVVFLPPA